MKKNILSAACLVCALSGTAFAGPAARIQDSEFTFGQMPPKSIVSHTFWLYSVGDEPIEIDTVISGCGCTSFPLSKKIVAPGDSVGLEMWFSSKGFRGRVAKKPTFRLKGDTTMHAFKFYADVILEPKDLYPIAAFPPVFDFSQSSDKDKFENKYAIQNRADQDVSIRIVDHDPKILDITAPDTLRAGEIWEGWVSLTPDYRGAPFVTSVTFEVNGSPMNRLTIPVVGKPPQTHADSLKFDFSKSFPQHD